MKQPKVIKRYANRKLYDTERSCYVTLEEISQMIKEGEDVQVVDNKTKDDLTAVTLAQIIVEEEKKVARMPLKLLRSIIQSGNEALGDFYKTRVADPVQNLREDVERRVEGLFRREDKRAEGDEGAEASAAEALPNGEAGENGVAGDEAILDGDGERHGGVVREWVTATQETLETFQRRVDERVKETLGKMTHLTTVGTDVDALRQRIAELESRLKELEERRSKPQA